MKKYLLILTTLLLMAGSGCSGSPNIPPSPSPTVEVTLVPTPVIKYGLTEFNENSENPAYQIKVEIPYLMDAKGLPVGSFKQLVDDLLQAEIESFRKAVGEIKPDPSFQVGSSLEIDVDQLFPPGNIISLKFIVHSYYAGAAHPGEKNLTFNYSLADDRQLTLEELFQPGSNYLERIADLCKYQLSQRDIAFDEQIKGADPTQENYRNWNITADGLLITFDMYQVAAGAAGPQTVLIPYSELKDLIDSQGPLSEFGN